MIKILYANKITGTVVHDIYLSCSESGLHEHILKFGTAEVEFPDKLVKELPSSELDLLMMALSKPSKLQKEILKCFYISSVKIWKEVSEMEFHNSLEIFLDEDYKSNERLLNNKR